MTKWILSGFAESKKENIKEILVNIVEQTNLPLPLAHVLAVRGYTKPNQLQQFLEADITNMYDPVLMKDMAKAAQIIFKAISDKQKIAVFGDYDADGITSTAILYKTLLDLGAKPIYYIPQRETEGYGLNNEAITNLAEQGVELLITCDNGISAGPQVAYGNSLGLTIIITDHHEVPFELLDDGRKKYILPPAAAIINPKQADCNYPCKILCAGAISYKIAQYLYPKAGLVWQNVAEEYLQLAAIATVCDIMDLIDENRIIVKNALPMLKTSKNPGINALLTATGLTDKELDTYHIGYILGPSINASGRIEIANVAVELFLTTDQTKAKEVAESLVALNQMRKQMTTDGVEEILKTIEAENLQNDKVIVAHSLKIAESIAGIIAGRIKENYYRPTFVLAGNKELIRGSGRSIEGYNMFEALQQSAHLLDVFGGHPMAAGLTIKQDNIQKLRGLLNKNCQLEIMDMEPYIRIDRLLGLEQVNLELAEQINLLAPFGKGNKEPIFAAKNVQINKILLLGNQQQVIKLQIKNKNNGQNIFAILFKERPRFEAMVKEHWGQETWKQLITTNKSEISLDIVYTVEVNNYKNISNPQIQIKDFRPTKY